MSARTFSFFILALAIGIFGSRFARAQSTPTNAAVPLCPSTPEAPIAPYMQCAPTDVVSDEGDALLYCPSTPTPHSLIVVAADPTTKKFNHSAFAHALTERGFAVAMIDARFPQWRNGDAVMQSRFAANEYAPVIRRVSAALAKKHRGGTHGCNLASAYAILGFGGGGESALFAVNQQIENGEPNPSALILTSMPSSDVLKIAPLAVPTLAFGTTYFLQPQVHASASQQVIDNAFSAEHAHIDVLDDRTNATLFSETPITGDCISSCRRPAWDQGEMSRAAVTDRIAIWMQAYVEVDRTALATVASWDRAMLVHPKIVEPDPAYKDAIDKEHEENEKRLNAPQVLPLVSLPLIVGGTTRPGPNGGGFAIGVRPELIVGLIHDRIGEPRSGFGFGGYLSALTISGEISRETLYGVGGTLVLYTGDFGVAVSGGVDGPATGGSPLATIGGFIGFRGDHDMGDIDLPFGLRVDGRLGPFNQQSITVAGQIDLMALVMGGVAFAALATPHD